MKDLFTTLGPQLAAGISALVTAAFAWIIRKIEKPAAEKRARDKALNGK